MVFLYVTCKNTEEARRLAKMLVEERAAGWVNVTPAHAVYRQGGEVKEAADGAAIIVKTIESKVQHVEDVVRANHTSRIPCIAAFSLYRLNREYKDWLISTVV